MEIVRVEKLGDLVAYKPKEIQVIGNVYDKIPVEFMEDFKLVCNSAKTKYEALVAEDKSAGRKPASAQHKKTSIEELIKPFLKNHGLIDEVSVKVIRATSPRIPSDSDRSYVRSAKSLVQEVELNLDEMSDLFDNFDSDTLDDTHVDIPTDEVEGALPITSVTLDEDLFDGDAFDVDFESLMD